MGQIELIIQNVHNQLNNYIPDNYELAQSKSYRVWKRNLVMMTTDNLKREEVIKVYLDNILSSTTTEKINKSSCYLQKYHTYRIPLSQGDSVYHPIIAVFSRILQISPKNLVTTGYCKFLINILVFIFSIKFLNTSLVELNITFDRQ